MAIPQGVLYVPGAAFYPLAGEAFLGGRLVDNVIKRNTMRLSFSFNSDEEVDQGIRRLGELLGRAHRAAPAPASAMHA